MKSLPIWFALLSYAFSAWRFFRGEYVISIADTVEGCFWLLLAIALKETK